MSCCKRPCLVTLDYYRNDLTRVHNRTCTACGRHWLADESGLITEYTRAQWDLWMGEALKVAE